MKLYETHIPVSNLEQSKQFYCDVMGLEVAFEQPQRNVIFLWIGGPEEGMLGLWGPGSLYGWKEVEHFKSHFAISIPLKELLQMPTKLQGLGIETRGFGGAPATEPSVIGWMPSAQLYFADPDSHSLEYITILDDAPDAEFFGPWSEWCDRYRRR